jgi:hypothetical protein
VHYGPGHQTLSPTRVGASSYELPTRDRPAPYISATLLSPGSQKRLACLHKLQQNIRSSPYGSGGGLDQKILIALEAMQASFAEIAAYKQ